MTLGLLLRHSLDLLGIGMLDGLSLSYLLGLLSSLHCARRRLSTWFTPWFASSNSVLRWRSLDGRWSSWSRCGRDSCSDS